MSFGEVYSKYYDLFYSDKDYKKECDFLEKVFRRYSGRKPRDIIEVGCGTGGHMVHLARRGYHMVGLDKSPWMCQAARARLGREKLEGELVVSDILEWKSGAKFDACISMFAVMNYIVRTADLVSVFNKIRWHLRPGGLFAFETWYGPAVLRIMPSARYAIYHDHGTEVVRAVVPELDTFRHVQKSQYHIIATRDGRVVDRADETHELRFLFPQEVYHLLGVAGFEVMNLCDFMNLDRRPSESTWSAFVVAKAV